MAGFSFTEETLGGTLLWMPLWMPLGTPMGQVVIAEDLGDADPVIAKNPLPALFLGLPVARQTVPRLDRVPVAPKRQRHKFIFLGHALEPSD